MKSRRVATTVLNIPIDQDDPADAPLGKRQRSATAKSANSRVQAQKPTRQTSP